MERKRGVVRALSFTVVSVCGLAPAARGQNTVSFGMMDTGVIKSVAEWGVDTAWPSHDNVRQSVAHMGAANVDVVRLTFHPGQPLTANGDGTYSLSATAKGYINDQLTLVAMAGVGKPLTLVPGEFAAPFNSTQWLRTIKATQEYINSRTGWTMTAIKSIEVFNEPDFWPGEGNASQLNSLITQLKAYPVFQNTAFPAGSTLNSNNARGWYDPVPAATQGSSHLLGGSLTSYVNFMEYVKGTGKAFVNPELHSLGEAIVGAEHGMVSGTWWGDILRARGLFVQASDGKRLGYAEDLGRQSAAAVYRAPNGKTYAFAGGLERFGQQTSYRFVSSDRDVYFNGIPVRQYVLQTKFDETAAANPAGNDFENYGSWSNQGAYADVETGAGLAPLDGYRWKIVNTQTGQVMEVTGGGTGDGAGIRTAADAGGLNQKWDIVRTRNGYFHLFNANSGRTAEVANGSLSNGGTVRQWGTADNQNQQWYIEDAGGGAFHIRNAYSNKYLSASTTNNVQWDNTGAIANLQKWRFVPANPNSPAKAHYAFAGNVNDGVGTNHATVIGGPTYGSGPGGQAQAITLDGADDYVKLPGGVASGSNITIAAYVKWDGGGAWQRIFDFGNDTNSYMFLTPRSADNTMRFAIKASASGGEQMLDTSPLPVGQWVHLALTLGGNTGVLYVDGKPRVAGQVLLDPSHVKPTLNYIGKSQWPDPLFDGMIDEFRVYDYALDPGQVGSFVYQRWTGEAGGGWTASSQASPKNWQRNVAGADYADGSSVLFDDYATSFMVGVSDAAVSPASTQFDNRNNGYVLSGPGGIAGTGSLTKNGAGVLTVNNANAYSGGTVLNGGTLNINNASAIGTGVLTVGAWTTVDNTSGAAVMLSTDNAQEWSGDFTFGGTSALNMGTGAVTISGDRTVTVNGAAVVTIGPVGQSGGGRSLTKAGAGTLVMSAVRIGGTLTASAGVLRVAASAAGTGVSVVGNLAISPGATLDLVDNDMIVDYTGPSPVGDILSRFKAAYNGGAWGGVGLTSSAANSPAAAGATTLAIAENAALGLADFAGIGVDTTAVLIKYTWYGDVNMNGRVDPDDYAVLDRSFAKGGLAGSARWVDGDVNYDGLVSQADYLLADGAFAKQGGGALSAAFLAQRGARFGEGYVQALQAVIPDPGNAGLCASAFIVNSWRPRRRVRNGVTVLRKTP